MPDTGEKSSYNDNEEVSVFPFIINFKTMAMCAMMILLKSPKKNWIELTPPTHPLPNHPNLLGYVGG